MSFDPDFSGAHAEALVMPVSSQEEKVASKVNLAEIANEACVATDGDTSEGAKKLLQILKRRHHDFYKEKARETMFLWAQDQMRNARTRLRGQLASGPRGRMTVANQAVDSASLKSAAAAWFGWPVLPGVMLGDAKREHLELAARVYLRDAAVYTKRGQWLKAIADACPDDDTKVSDALDEATIEKMAAEFGVSHE